MRLKRILILAFSLALALTTGPALASSLVSDWTNNFQFSLGNIPVDSGRVEVVAQIDGYARHNPEEDQQDTKQGHTYGGSVTVTAQKTSPNWLNNTYASVTGTAGSGSIITNFSGTGPVALGITGSDTGVIRQQSWNSINLRYVCTTGGQYTFSLTDIYSYSYSLNENNSGNQFSHVGWQGELLIILQHRDPISDNWVYDIEADVWLPYYMPHIGDIGGPPLANMGDSATDLVYELNKDLTLLDDTIYNLSIYFGGSQVGHTIPNTNPVPLPGTALLLGSGLMGLWAVRRKYLG